jgi:hypothetical protein
MYPTNYAVNFRMITEVSARKRGRHDHIRCRVHPLLPVFIVIAGRKLTH